MRKVIVLEFMSLDSVIQGPGGPKEDPSGGFQYSGWQAPVSDDAVGEVMNRQMTVPFDLLLGRKTFEIWEPFWPKHGDMWPGAQTATKYVVSNTMKSADWQPNVFISGDVADKISKIKQQDGPDLHVYGSANLVQTLFKHDLVDEMWLKIFPLTLGSGKRLFGDGTIPATFKVTESQVTPGGVIIVNYQRAGAVKTGDL